VCACACFGGGMIKPFPNVERESRRLYLLSGRDYNITTTDDERTKKKASRRYLSWVYNIYII